MQNRKIYIDEFISPLGTVYAGATEEGVYFVDFSKERVDKAIKNFGKTLGVAVMWNSI